MMWVRRVGGLAVFIAGLVGGLLLQWSDQQLLGQLPSISGAQQGAQRETKLSAPARLSTPAVIGVSLAAGPAPMDAAVWAGRPSGLDRDFIHSMMLHHDQAVTLSMIAENGGELAEVKRVARAIVLNQLHEIGQMRGWLSAWGLFQAGNGLSMDWVQGVKPRSYHDEIYMSRCASSNGRMPGYFTPNQIEKLRQAEGLDRDRLFLNMMLKHHDEAVQMANFAHGHATSSLIKGLTRSIVVEQGLEMAHFKKILEGLDSQNSLSQREADSNKGRKG